MCEEIIVNSKIHAIYIVSVFFFFSCLEHNRITSSFFFLYRKKPILSTCKENKFDFRTVGTINSSFLWFSVYLYSLFLNHRRNGLDELNEIIRFKINQIHKMNVNFFNLLSTEYLSLLHEFFSNKMIHFNEISRRKLYKKLRNSMQYYINI